MTTDAEWLRTAADDLRRGYDISGYARRFEEIADRIERGVATPLAHSVPKALPKVHRRGRTGIFRRP